MEELKSYKLLLLWRRPDQELPMSAIVYEIWRTGSELRNIRKEVARQTGNPKQAQPPLSVCSFRWAAGLRPVAMATSDAGVSRCQTGQIKV
jgi:hypothetical protein